MAVNSMLPSSMLPPSLHVLGTGSIGLLFAASIRRALPTFPVTVLLRSGRGHEKRIWRKRCASSGMEYDGVTAKVARPNATNDACLSFSADIPAEIISSDQTAATPATMIQNLLVATKAPDAAAAVSSVLHRMDTDNGSNIIILSNGAMAVRDEIQVLLRKEGCGASQLNTNITLASTTHGAYRTASQDVAHEGGSNPYSIIHAGIGSTFVESRPIANLFEAAGLRAARASPDEMNVLLWKKLATNCAINPLTALHRCANGELVNMDNETNITMNGIIREVSRVALLDATDRGLPDESIQELQYERLLSFVSSVIQDTANNKSSMLQDVLAERETEIDYLNGFVARMARERCGGSECTFNENMVKKIKRLVGSVTQ